MHNANNDQSNNKNTSTLIRNSKNNKIWKKNKDDGNNKK